MVKASAENDNEHGRAASVDGIRFVPHLSRNELCDEMRRELDVERKIPENELRDLFSFVWLRP